MKLHPFPKRIYIFDIHGTLNFEDMNTSQVPAKIAFDVIKKKEEVWAGTWSGMYTWMQLQKLTDFGITPDFILMKNEGNEFKKSMEHIYQRPFDCEVTCVGDQAEDKEWAQIYGFKYLTPAQFTNKLIDAGYIPRPVVTRTYRKRVQRHRPNMERDN